MSAGILALTNKSDVVAGTGTLFITELVAGDFILVTVGGVPYTLPVKTINSNTSLTLVSNFTGPTQSGAAWSAVPRVAMNLVTAALVVQSAEALRGLNYDKQNWQAVFSNNGNITVKLPDGSTFTGPSWAKIVDILNTLDVTHLEALAAQIDLDAQQVAADKIAADASKTDAATSASDAAASEVNAKQSETASENSEANAASSETLSRKYAVEPEDSVIQNGEFSSYHWAKKAEKSAEEAAAHNPNEALIKSQNLSDLTDRVAAWLNVRPEGPTPLAADPVSAKDAVTKEWAENLVAIKTGYAVLSVTNPALSSRTVLTNPYGNNTPVMCLAEVYHPTLGKWVSGDFVYTGTGVSYGTRASFADGDGIALQIGTTGYMGAASASGANFPFTANLTTPSPVRIHVWKLIP